MSAAAADVFLSYSRTDAPAVRQIQAYLKEAGLATFLDRDQLPPDQPWLSALEQAITRCAAVAVLVGPAGLGTWQQREVQLALDRQAEAERAGRSFPVIPILLPKVEDPPDGFLRLRVTRLWSRSLPSRVSMASSRPKKRPASSSRNGSRPR